MQLYLKGKAGDKWKEVSARLGNTESIQTGKSCETRISNELVELGIYTLLWKWSIKLTSNLGSKIMIYLKD